MKIPFCFIICGLENNWLSCGLNRIMIMKDCWREGWFSFRLVSTFRELIPKVVCHPRSHVLFLNNHTGLQRSPSPIAWPENSLSSEKMKKKPSPLYVSQRHFSALKTRYCHTSLLRERAYDHGHLDNNKIHLFPKFINCILIFFLSTATNINSNSQLTA